LLPDLADEIDPFEGFLVLREGFALTERLGVLNSSVSAGKSLCLGPPFV
jgi:hypothetical protein